MNENVLKGFCCFSYARTYFISKKEWAAFDTQFSPVEKHASKPRRSDINTNIIMLRSLSLKKDKSKNSTYILVNRVRRSLSSLFTLSSLCLALANWKGTILLSSLSSRWWLMIRTRSRLSLFLLLVLSRRTTRGDRLRTGYIFKNQIGPETSNSRTESTTTTIEQRLRKMQPRR